MKKVLLASAALMLVGGIVAPVFAADAAPGVVFDGDARVRLMYKSVDYADKFGQTLNATTGYASQANMDSRVRLNATGTTAGGTYAKVRIRIMENWMGNMDTDLYGINGQTQNNIWADQAYVGIPFSKDITLEVGKYRSTYGPLPTTYNFFYDDVQLTGFRGIIKINNDIVINPFVEWMNEAQNTFATTASTPNSNSSASSLASNTAYDTNRDNDEYRIGAHVKAKINKDWTVGGMLGYQVDNRADVPSQYSTTQFSTDHQPILNGEPNTGMFGSLYVNGKVGAFGLVSELAYTAAKLNGFNTWAEDSNTNAVNNNLLPASTVVDSIGSKNDGYGGYILPSYTIDKLTLAMTAGFTANGFRPDLAYGFVMLGGKDNSVIGDSIRIGDTGDWLWFGFVPSYAISDSLKLTANIVYASINSNANLQTPASKALMAAGQGDVPFTTTEPLSNALEVSGILQYTINKGTDVFFSAGYLKPSFNNNGTILSAATLSAYKDDPILGICTRLEVKF